ncbi:hypothetical protein STSP1_02365 [Sedimentisphaera salicampi]|uniref:Uncharacterized protein n=1 Tax=Sedimentisphaera salicampi TaxID=1941349 RepID=A0A1W6LQ85_9BACT|nr:hypothetical protein STSP1_02365 [Sedimentisphaera salicampi]
MDFFRFLQTIMFCICIAGGFLFLSLSYAAPEIELYFQNRQTLIETEKMIEKLREKKFICQSQMEMLKRDPKLLQIFHDKMFNVYKKASPYPEPSEQDSRKAELILKELGDIKTEDKSRWEWLKFAGKGQNRKLLFICGALLIVTAFTFLGGFNPHSNPNLGSQDKLSSGKEEEFAE